MSLVNLAHVCSHLQNASLARLGLTSIPYTRMHLSLALLLQKQGFFSQVRLGGPSPPASCFGQGPRDDHAVSNFPHDAASRDPFSKESALACMIRRACHADQLREYGFEMDAIAFARRHGRKSIRQLTSEGWVTETIKFIIDTRARIEALTEEKGEKLPKGAPLDEQRKDATKEILSLLPLSQSTLYRRYKKKAIAELKNIQFKIWDIEAVAGKETYLKEREVRQNGITVEAMGIKIPNQPVTLPVEKYQDIDGMETEGVVTQANRASRRLWLGLKYYESKPVLTKARMVSKPTKRIMLHHEDIARLVRGNRAGEVKPMTQIGEVLAISTHIGILDARECMERKVGGLALCRMW